MLCRFGVEAGPPSDLSGLFALVGNVVRIVLFPGVGPSVSFLREKRYLRLTNVEPTTDPMYIAQSKRKENIAEYILYLWQLEDLLRALQFLSLIHI